MVARAPYLLCGPALLLFAAVVVAPLGMTVLLSFHDFSTVKGIQPVFILKNWQELFTDPYFREMFARTLRISLWVTLICVVLGAPEAYILSRMAPRWRGFFLLVILAARPASSTRPSSSWDSSTRRSRSCSPRPAW